MDSFIKRAQGMGVTWSHGPISGRPGGMSIGNLGRAGAPMFSNRGYSQNSGPNVGAGMAALGGMFKDLKKFQKPKQPAAPQTQTQPAAPDAGAGDPSWLPTVEGITDAVSVASQFVPAVTSVVGKAFPAFGGAITSWNAAKEIGDYTGLSDGSPGFEQSYDDFLREADPNRVGFGKSYIKGKRNPLRSMYAIGEGAAQTGFDTTYEMMRSRGMVPSGTPAEQARQELPQQLHDATIGRYREAARARDLNRQLREQGLNPTYNDSAAQQQLPFATRAVQTGLRNTLPFGMGNYLPF